jgi:hypothetical protein
MLGLSARFFSSSVCDLRPLLIHRIGISLVEIQPILRKVVNFEQTSVFWYPKSIHYAHSLAEVVSAQTAPLIMIGFSV